MADSPAIRAGKAFVDRMESESVQEQNRLRIFCAVWRSAGMQAVMKDASRTLEAEEARRFKESGFPKKDGDWVKWMFRVSRMLGRDVNQENPESLQQKLEARFDRKYQDKKAELAAVADFEAIRDCVNSANTSDVRASGEVDPQLQDALDAIAAEEKSLDAGIDVDIAKAVRKHLTGKQNRRDILKSQEKQVQSLATRCRTAIKEKKARTSQ